MTPTPDSRYMYVAISGVDHTLAVDLRTLAIVAKIKTGARPARISTAILPLDRVNPTTTAGGAAGVAAMRQPRTVRRWTTSARRRRVARVRRQRWRHRWQRAHRGQAGAFPTAADIESYRSTVERVFMTDRGGTMPGYRGVRDVPYLADESALQLSRRRRPTPDGRVEQSRKNFDVVTKLVNTAAPATSRLLLKPLDPSAGGMGHTGGSVLDDRAPIRSIWRY